MILLNKQTCCFYIFYYLLIFSPKIMFCISSNKILIFFRGIFRTVHNSIYEFLGWEIQPIQNIQHNNIWCSISDVIFYIYNTNLPKSCNTLPPFFRIQISKFSIQIFIYGILAKHFQLLNKFFPIIFLFTAFMIILPPYVICILKMLKTILCHISIHNYSPFPNA